MTNSSGTTGAVCVKIENMFPLASHILDLALRRIIRKRFALRVLLTLPVGSVIMETMLYSRAKTINATSLIITLCAIVADVRYDIKCYTSLSCGGSGLSGIRTIVCRPYNDG